MSERAQCEVYLMINEDGEYVVSNDADAVRDLYDDSIGGTPANVRTYALTLSVPLPAGVVASATLPEDAQPGDVLTVTMEA